MTAKSKKSGPRRQRRALLARFESGYDFERLDYKGRVRPLHGKAKLIGVAAAGLVYFIAFVLGLYGWKQGFIDAGLFAKLVWILMVPATVTGLLVWLLVSNRLEYVIRQDLRDYIKGREADGGFLWRFAPLLDVLAADDYLAKRVMQQTRSTSDQIDPEEYATAVTSLYHRLQQSHPRDVNQDVIAEVMRNFDNCQG